MNWFRVTLGGLWALFASLMALPVYMIGWVRCLFNPKAAITPSGLWWWIPPLWHHLLWWGSFQLCMGVRHVHIGRNPKRQRGKRILFVPSHHPSRIGFIPYYWYLEHALSWKVLVSIKAKGVRGLYKWIVRDSLVALGLLFIFRRSDPTGSMLRLQERMRQLANWPGAFQVFLNSRPRAESIHESRRRLAREHPDEDFSWLIVPFPKDGGFLTVVDALPEDGRICFVFANFGQQYEGLRDLPRAIGGTFYTMAYEVEAWERDSLRCQDKEFEEDRRRRVRHWLLFKIWRPWCETLADIWDREDPGWRERLNL